MSHCDVLKQFLLTSLKQDIEAHEHGRYFEIGQSEKDIPDPKPCETEDEEEWQRLLIAMDFRERWQDARNHDWGYYPGVNQEDWPLIARQMCQGIIEQWEPDQMTNTLVFTSLPRPPKVPIWQRIKSLLGFF